MNHHSLLTSICIVSLSWNAAFAAETWSHDFAAAKKEARNQNQDLLLDFTGSDWCGPCIALRNAVLATPVFEAGVSGKFVLVELDYPKKEDLLSAATLQQNKQLQKAYGVSAYPTVVLCDASGLPYASIVGYGIKDPAAYLEKLAELQGKKAARDQAFAAARAAQGPEKARMLAAALTDLQLDDSLLFSSFSEVLEEIRQADPEDASGYTRRAASKKAMARFETDLESYMEEPGIHMMRGVGDRKGAAEMIRKLIAEGHLQPDDLTEIACFRATRIFAPDDYDAAIRSLDELKAADLDEASAKKLSQTRAALERAQKIAATKAATTPKAAD